MIIQKYKQICKECGEVYYFDYEGSDALDKDYFDQVVTECTKCGSRDFEKVDLNLLDKTKLKFRKLACRDKEITMTTLDEVVKAVDNKEDCIVIEGDKANDVYRIVVTGKVVWLVALGAILIAVGCVAATATSAGTSSPVTAPVAALTATAAIGIIGYSATTTAVGMCALAGGVFAGKSMLNSLRDNYIATQITKNSDGDVTKIVLKRK